MLLSVSVAVFRRVTERSTVFAGVLKGTLSIRSCHRPWQAKARSPQHTPPAEQDLTVSGQQRSRRRAPTVSFPELVAARGHPPKLADRPSLSLELPLVWNADAASCPACLIRRLPGTPGVDGISNTVQPPSTWPSSPRPPRTLELRRAPRELIASLPFVQVLSPTARDATARISRQEIDPGQAAVSSGAPTRLSPEGGRREASRPRQALGTTIAPDARAGRDEMRAQGETSSPRIAPPAMATGGGGEDGDTAGGPQPLQVEACPAAGASSLQASRPFRPERIVRAPASGDLPPRRRHHGHGVQLFQLLDGRRHAQPTSLASENKKQSPRRRSARFLGSSTPGGHSPTSPSDVAPRSRACLTWTTQPPLTAVHARCGTLVLDLTDRKASRGGRCFKYRPPESLFRSPSAPDRHAPGPPPLPSRSPPPVTA
ncbi:hypothetical protein PVAP13_4KG024716 [Panicum virgatum]|uniref:Uncharacterized protein n=1 Tax=Panicum virgatum TaxID=38727 RepID=A0A8T0TJI4_PANVG|nr:hypothetical protein PVAP13_4KG024716 [Panicum virgatum]